MKYRCPKCGSTDLDVNISCWARLYQDDEDVTGTVPDEAECGDHEWDESSQMVCTDCGHGDHSKEFEVEL